MALQFQPRPGMIVMCDFRGFIVPEMVKTRPVVVLARNRQTRELVTVVPLSTTEPQPRQPYHHELAANPMPGKQGVRCWAKCDMICTVSLARLDRVRVDRKTYLTLMLGDGEFLAIRRATTRALGLDTLP